MRKTAIGGMLALLGLGIAGVQVTPIFAARLQGAAAIRPHIAIRSELSATFTVKDVVNYMAGHSPLNIAPSRAHSVITTIMFAPSHDVRALLGGRDIDRPSDSLLCYVETRIWHSYSSIYQRGYAVFDAHTGNLLLSGYLHPQASPKDPPQLYAASGPPPVPGIPAIPPRNPSADASTPAFTVDDAVQFVSKNGLPIGDVVGGGLPTIVQVRFVRSSEASALMQGESVGRPDDALVCYVELSGPFKLSHTALLSGTTIPTVQTGVELFDAHTGNLLISGGHN